MLAFFRYVGVINSYAKHSGIIFSMTVMVLPIMPAHTTLGTFPLLTGA